MNPRAHIERDEVCPVPGCIDHFGEGEVMCTTHWGELPRYMRAEVRRAWDAVEEAAPGPDRIQAKVEHAGVVEWAVESIAEEAA